VPKSKTIVIDEILPAGEDGNPHPHKPNNPNPQPDNSDDPLSDFTRRLPWKARLTLKLTSWFIFLRSKSWGKWIIAPAIILALLLIIPLSLIAIIFLILKSFLSSFSTPENPNKNSLQP